MKCKFINIKVKDKNQEILELFKLSLGNNVNSLYYNKNKKECSNKNLKITYLKNILEKILEK